MRVDATPDWRAVIDTFIDRAGHDPTWQAVADTATIVVHGSVTVGLADKYSDIDLHVIVPDDLYNNIYTSAIAAGQLLPGQRLVLHRSTRRTPDQRRTLCAAELRATSDLQAALDAELPVELWVMNHAWVIQDPGDRVATILATATQHFEDKLEQLTATELGHLTRRQRWLAIAYQRRDHNASRAFLTTNFVRAAMRLACLLDDSPTPYDKWLVAWTARNTRLGAKLNAPCLNLLLGHIHRDHIEQISDQVIAATTASARDRWPDRAWVTDPMHFGPVRS